jgi:hypothetical protein
VKTSQISFAILLGILLSAVVWYRSGYVLGSNTSKATLIGHYFSIGMTGFYLAVISIGLCFFKGWNISVLALGTILISINHSGFKNYVFERGAKSRISNLVPEHVIVERVERLGPFKPWVIVLTDNTGIIIRKEVKRVGSGRNGPWCVLVSDRYPISDFDPSFLGEELRDEWHKVKAIRELSEGKYRSISVRGVQFIWTFGVTIQD